jgi:hypothetical protein
VAYQTEAERAADIAAHYKIYSGTEAQLAALFAAIQIRADGYLLVSEAELAAALRVSHQDVPNHGHCTWTSDHQVQAAAIFAALSGAAQEQDLNDPRPVSLPSKWEPMTAEEEARLRSEAMRPVSPPSELTAIRSRVTRDYSARRKPLDTAPYQERALWQAREDIDYLLRTLDAARAAPQADEGLHCPCEGHLQARLSDGCRCDDHVHEREDIAAAPVPAGLDAAWYEAEAALPEGHGILSLTPDHAGGTRREPLMSDEDVVTPLTDEELEIVRDRLWLDQRPHGGSSLWSGRDVARLYATLERDRAHCYRCGTPTGSAHSIECSGT